MDARHVRGRLLAQTQDKRIKHVEGAMWFVPSHTAGGHLVNVAAGSCTCPDYQQHPTKCKHQWAVELVRSGGQAEPDGAQAEAGAEPVKVPSPKMGRMSDFTAEEQGHIRMALRFLRIRCGGWEPLAKALRLKVKSIQPMARRQKVSARLALRLARFAGVPVEDMIAGKYPPAGTCPHCGHRPETASAEVASLV